MDDDGNGTMDFEEFYAMLTVGGGGLDTGNGVCARCERSRGLPSKGASCAVELELSWF